ncbi:MAG: protein kinase [Kofleriaceae bacterium]
MIVAAHDRELVGPYRILKAIGSGGSARIDLARIDRAYNFQRHVVLKRPLEHLRGDPKAAAALQREARLGGQLHHPNLIAVLDAGTHDDYDYLVLEYVHGSSLRAAMQADAAGEVADVPLGVALAIAIDTARGLHAAHELVDDRGASRGLVHRDVSPGNVLLGLAGTVKLADFGIAKETRISTLSGSLHGTVTYMAPEQCRGHAFDRRADVFSLGVILYELVTGARRFLADNDVASLHRVLSGQVTRPRTVKPSIAPALEELVMAALATDPDQRMPTARVLADALEAFAAEHGEPVGARWIARWMHDLHGPREAPWYGHSTQIDLARRAPAPSDGSLVALIGAAPAAPPRASSRRAGTVAVIASLGIAGAIAWGTATRPAAPFARHLEPATEGLTAPATPSSVSPIAIPPAPLATPPSPAVTRWSGPGPRPTRALPTTRRPRDGSRARAGAKVRPGLPDPRTDVQPTEPTVVPTDKPAEAPTAKPTVSQRRTRSSGIPRSCCRLIDRAASDDACARGRPDVATLALRAQPVASDPARTPGAADPSAEDPIDHHISLARAHIARGELADARAQLQAAYALEARPALLFALGQVELNLGNYPAAIAYYERFIATGPATEQITLAQQAIGAARMRIVTPPPQPEQVVKLVERPRPIYRRQWRIENTGLVVLGGLAGIASGALFRHADQLGEDRSGTLIDYDARVDQSHTEQWVALGLAAVGLAAATIAVVRWRLDRTEVRVSARAEGANVTAAAILNMRW